MKFQLARFKAFLGADRRLLRPGVYRPGRNGLAVRDVYVGKRATLDVSERFMSCRNCWVHGTLHIPNPQPLPISALMSQQAMARWN